MLLLINNFNEKHHRKSRPTKLTLKACARYICNLHSCYNFELVLHENALVLSQSEARKFVIHIITLTKNFVRYKEKLSLNSCISQFAKNAEAFWFQEHEAAESIGTPFCTRLKFIAGEVYTTFFFYCFLRPFNIKSNECHVQKKSHKIAPVRDKSVSVSMAFPIHSKSVHGGTHLSSVWSQFAFEHVEGLWT